MAVKQPDPTGLVGSVAECIGSHVEQKESCLRRGRERDTFTFVHKDKAGAFQVSSLQLARMYAVLKYKPTTFM